VDWAAAGPEPAPGATYYLTVAQVIDTVGVTATLNALAGTVTFPTPPAANQAVMVQYIYGTPTGGASTLAYQQTGNERWGLNSIFIDTTYPSRYLLPYVALAYDWLYQYQGLTAPLRAEMRRALAEWSDFIRDNGYYADSPTSNYGAAHYCGRVFTAVAKDDRDVGGDAARVAEIQTYRTNNTLPLFVTTPPPGYGAYQGGYWAEGWSYGELACENLVLASLAMEAYGLADVSGERAWAAEAINALLHAQVSTDLTSGRQGTQVPVGDWYAYPAPVNAKDLWALLAYASSDPAASAYANSFIQNPAQAQESGWLDILFRDPGAAATDWTAVPIPLDTRSPYTGIVLSRAAWDYASANVTFINGNIAPADHQQNTAGDLLVQRAADDLLVSPDAVGHLHNHKRAGDQNVVVLDDNGTGLMTYRWTQGFWAGAPGCTMPRYEAVPAYMYSVGDYVAAYSSFDAPGGGGAGSELQRSVFYARPDVIVVHDRATTKPTGVGGTEYPKRLQWHVNGDPTVSGTTLAHTVGSSKVAVTVFSGSALTGTKVGPLTFDEARDIYRLEVRNSSPQDKVRYCSVIQTAASGGGVYTAVRVASTGGEFEGACVNGRLVVLFGDVAGPVNTSGGKSYAHTGTTGQTVTHHICDLNPGQVYSLSGAASGTATATAAGVITFTTTGTGSAQTVTVT
jgi:hypothetical protein